MYGAQLDITELESQYIMMNMSGLTLAQTLRNVQQVTRKTALQSLFVPLELGVGI